MIIYGWDVIGQLKLPNGIELKEKTRTPGSTCCCPEPAFRYLFWTNIKDIQSILLRHASHHCMYHRASGDSVERAYFVEVTDIADVLMLEKWIFPYLPAGRARLDIHEYLQDGQTPTLIDAFTHRPDYLTITRDIVVDL